MFLKMIWEVVKMMDAINRRKLLNELKSYEFILTELNLYLNSHPMDRNALKMHAEAADKAECLKKRYVQAYGPLTARGNTNPEKWEWINGPWPWENC